MGKKQINYFGDTTLSEFLEEIKDRVISKITKLESDMPTKISDLENDINVLTVNDKASVGQMLIVEEIDANGQPVKWRTVDVFTKTSQLENDSDFISTETDPTVPAWAKNSSKPDYTVEEIDNAVSQEELHEVEQALEVHNHDGRYSFTNHNHDNKYSPTGHNHDNKYSPINHNHDSSYSSIDHNHTWDNIEKKPFNVIDTVLSESSENPVQNKAITQSIQLINDTIDNEIKTSISQKTQVQLITWEDDD